MNADLSTLEPSIVGAAGGELRHAGTTLVFAAGVWCGYFTAADPGRNWIRRPAPVVCEWKWKRRPDAASASNYGYPGVQSGLRDISSGGIWPLDADQLRFTGYRRSPDSTALACVFAFATGAVLLHYRIREDGAVLRSIELEYTGDEDYCLYELVMHSPYFGWDGPEEGLELSIYDLRNNLGNLRRRLGHPQNFPGDRIPGREHRFTAMDCDIHHEIVMVLGDPVARRQLLLWGHSPEGEGVGYSYREEEDAIALAQSFFAFAALRECRRIRCGTQHLEMVTGDWATARRRLGAIKTAAGWSAAPVPEGLRQAVMYQLHPFIADFGGFAQLERDLDRLADLGISVLYLPPLAPPEAYLNYAPDAVAPCFGMPEELRSLVTAAHRRDIRVIVDMIAHHVFRQSPAAARPDFIRYDEAGVALSYSITAVLTETASPAYQEWYIGCCRRLLVEFDLDGFRFDVAGFQLPNWGGPVPLPYARPGLGVLAQSGLLRRLRQELGGERPRIFLEEGFGVNGFRYVSHGWIHLLKKIKYPALREGRPLADFLRQLKLLLQERELKDRPGVLTMYHAKIHDTVLMQHFGSELDGADRAITALILLLDGVPLLTQGMERGHFALLRRLIRLRRLAPELAGGSVEFDEEDGDILKFRRCDGGHCAQIAINFADATRETAFPAAGVIAAAEGAEWRHGRLQLAPFGMALVLDRTVALPASGREVSCVGAGEESGIGGLPLMLWLRENDDDAASEVPDDAAVDEGSFSGSYQQGAVRETAATGTAWRELEYDDCGWLPAFVPHSRQPYRCCGSPTFWSCIESTEPELTACLWTRSPRLRGGWARFRRRILLTELPLRAWAELASPAFYDFDLAVANGGVTEALMAQENELHFFVNGVEAVPGSDFAGLLRPGENLLAVAVRRGAGTHGFGGVIPFVYPDGRREELRVDSGWLAAPAGWVRALPAGARLTAGNRQVEEMMVPEHPGCRFEVEIIRGQGRWSVAVTPPPGLRAVWQLTVPAPSWEAVDSGFRCEGRLGEWGDIRNAYSGALLPVWSASGSGMAVAPVYGADVWQLQPEHSELAAVFEIPGGFQLQSGAERLRVLRRKGG